MNLLTIAEHDAVAIGDMLALATTTATPLAGKGVALLFSRNQALGPGIRWKWPLHRSADNPIAVRAGRSRCRQPRDSSRYRPHPRLLSLDRRSAGQGPRSARRFFRPQSRERRS